MKIRVNSSLPSLSLRSIVSYSLQLEERKSSALLVQTCKPLVRLKKANEGCLLRYLSPAQSTEQVIAKRLRSRKKVKIAYSSSATRIG